MAWQVVGSLSRMMAGASVYWPSHSEFTELFSAWLGDGPVGAVVQRDGPQMGKASSCPRVA